MEENQNQATTAPEPSPVRENQNVSFPTVGAPQKSGAPKTILIVGILILVAVLGFVVYKSATNKKTDVVTEPTAFDNALTPSTDSSTTTEPTPVVTSTPKSSDRSSVSIVVQNGTGITGEAAYLQNALKKLGYSDIKVGNAGSQDTVNTTVTFAKTLASDIQAEITKELNTIYQKVVTTTSSSTTSDVLVVTGLRKGVTPKPSASPVASPKASASPTATP